MAITFDSKKFADIKTRLNDLQDCHGQKIKEGGFLMLDTVVLREAQWMAQQLSRFTRKLEIAEVEAENDDAEFEAFEQKEAAERRQKKDKAELATA